MSAPAGQRAPVAPVGTRVRGSLFASGCSFVVSVGTYAAVGRFVEPAAYGNAAVVLALWGLLAVPLEWAGGVLMRYGPVELVRDGSLRKTLSARLALALPLLLALLPAAPLYLAVRRGWPAWLCALTIPWLLATLAANAAQWSGVAAQRFGPLTVASSLNRAAPLLVVLALSMLGRPVHASALVAAALLGLLLAAAVPLFALRRLLGLERPDRALLSAMWRYSLPSLLTLPFGAAMTYVDPLVLDRSVSHAQVGCYQLAYAVISVFGMLGASFNSVLSPELVRAWAEGNRRAVHAYLDRDQPRLAIFLGGAALGAACLAGPLAAALLPARYAGAAPIAAVLTVAGAFMAGVWSLHPLVTVSDGTWALNIASAASAITNVALDFALAPVAGTVGVALANVAAWLVQLVLLAVLLHRRVGARLTGVAVLAPAGALVLALVLAERVPPLARALVGVLLLSASAIGALRYLRRARRSLSA